MVGFNCQGFPTKAEAKTLVVMVLVITVPANAGAYHSVVLRLKWAEVVAQHPAELLIL